MIKGWEDARLMQAYDLIYSVFRSYPATIDKIVVDDVLDTIEAIDDSLKGGVDD